MLSFACLYTRSCALLSPPPAQRVSEEMEVELGDEVSYATRAPPFLPHSPTLLPHSPPSLPPPGGLRHPLRGLHVRQDRDKVHDGRRAAARVPARGGPGQLLGAHHGRGARALAAHRCVGEGEAQRERPRGRRGWMRGCVGEGEGHWERPRGRSGCVGGWVAARLDRHFCSHPAPPIPIPPMPIPSFQMCSSVSSRKSPRADATSRCVAGPPGSPPLVPFPGTLTLSPGPSQVRCGHACGSLPPLTSRHAPPPVRR